MILNQKKKTLCCLMLSTSIALFSTNLVYAGDNTQNTSKELVPFFDRDRDGDGDIDTDDVIFYVPASDLDANGRYIGTGGDYGYGELYGYYNNQYVPYNIQYTNGGYWAVDEKGNAIDVFLGNGAPLSHDAVSAALNVFNTARSKGIELPRDYVVKNGFRGKKQHLEKPFDFLQSNKMLTKEDNASRAQSVLKAVHDNGPLQLTKEQYRVWLCPYSSQKHIRGEDASRYWLLGSLVGFQFDDMKNSYTAGTFLEFHIGNARSKITAENGDNIRGVGLAFFGSYGAWDGGRLDALFMHNRNKISSNRLTTQGLAKSNKNLDISVLDLQTSHLVKIPGDVWSVRFNIGNTFTHEKTGRYTEWGAGNQNIRRNSVISKDAEIFGGIGVRWNNRDEKWRTRVTGVYEIGKEYYKKGSTSKVSFGDNFSSTFASPNSNKKEVIQYATLYMTVNNNTGWKFFLAYNGNFTKNAVSTTFTAKVEYRF